MSQKPGEINALLGKGSEFEGKLLFEGTVRIDGKFKGEIKSSDTLIVGEGAKVEAEISVGRLISYGDISGNIVANGSINLHAPAVMSGSLNTKSLTIEEGVRFDGSCLMGEKGTAQPSTSAKKDANGSKKS